MAPKNLWYLLVRYLRRNDLQRLPDILNPRFLDQSNSMCKHTWGLTAQCDNIVTILCRIPDDIIGVSRNRLDSVI